MKQYTKILAILTSAVLFFFAGFSIGHKTGQETQPDIVYPTTFYATVTEVYETTLAVKGLDINQINYRGDFSLVLSEDTELIWRGTSAELSEFRPGLTVSVSFTGYILETDPAGLTEVCRVEILDDNFR